MTEQNDRDIDLLKGQIGHWAREDWHKMANAVDATSLTMAMMQERQATIVEDVAEIKGDVRATNALLRDLIGTAARLDERTQTAKIEGRNAGATWGAAIGTLVALLSAAWQALRG